MIIDFLFYSVSISDWAYAWSGNLAMNLIINSRVNVQLFIFKDDVLS